MTSYGFMLPHPDLKSQDPNLSSDFMYIGEKVCGVADGVSQWKKYQINPRKFAEELLQKSCSILEQKINALVTQGQQHSLVDVGKRCLNEAYHETKEPGSSTIIQYYLLGQQIYISYIGDSGLMILRPDQNNHYQIIFKTEPNIFKFNTPCQLIKWPDQNIIDKISNQLLRKELMDLMEISRTNITIMPYDAQSFQIPVQDKDIIICGSDGIFDNIFDHQIIQATEECEDQSQLAQKLCQLSYDLSSKRDYLSPFAKEGQKNEFKYLGGKKDDITVVVSLISDAIN